MFQMGYDRRQTGQKLPIEKYVINIMEKEKLSYLRMMEAMARTNSPEDQPEFEDLSELFELLSDLPMSGNMAEITPELYHRLITMARGELREK